MSNSNPKTTRSALSLVGRHQNGQNQRANNEEDDKHQHIFTDVIEENVYAGPHGTLIPVLPEHADRWSIVSTQTLVQGKRGSEIPVDYETAVEECGHGWYQYKLMILCGFVYACCSLSCTTLSFVLPAAQCDFGLTSADKGILITAPLWGMMIGGYVWGSFADSKGRRFVLLWSLGIDAFASFFSSLCQNFYCFYAFRIFNGFGIIGATSIVFAYLGEFLDYVHRDKYLGRLELFWTAGIVFLPCIGITILPWKFSFNIADFFVYNSWRAFVFACGIPSLVSFLLISRMPESPRFLMLQGKLHKAKEVLDKIFVTNTGKRKEEFSVKVLDVTPEADHYYFRGENHSCWSRISNMASGVYKQHKILLKGRSLFNITTTCIIDFCLIMVYFTMILWVPEVLNRQKSYYDKNPNSTTRLCEVSIKKEHSTL